MITFIVKLHRYGVYMILLLLDETFKKNYVDLKVFKEKKYEEVNIVWNYSKSFASLGIKNKSIIIIYRNKMF